MPEQVPGKVAQETIDAINCNLENFSEVPGDETDVAELLIVASDRAIENAGEQQAVEQAKEAARRIFNRDNES